jgi:acetyl-CoA synthetase
LDRVPEFRIKSALVSHYAVVVAAVISNPDVVKGMSIKAFVILRLGHETSENLKQDLLYRVRTALGPIAVSHETDFVDNLPTAWSRKIMRRVLKVKGIAIDPSDISPLIE